MKQALENQHNLDIYQAEIIEILFENKQVTGVKTRAGELFCAKNIIIACGTYLSSNIIIGESSTESGPDNSLSAVYLTENLRANGIEMLRFKTGTPARIHADSINYDVLDVQYGDDEITRFSGETGEFNVNQDVCYIAYTNERTHEIIRANLHRSPMYSGNIKGTGARYCPSIEDKIVRFADKEASDFY
jgi:tRNA uridine 5-carboxymethylaminomethyl modification enzyme